MNDLPLLLMETNYNLKTCIQKTGFLTQKEGGIEMASYSQHKNLELPASPEHYDIGVFNKNAIVIDSELHKLDLKNESQDKLLATKESLNSEIARATLKEDNILNSLSSEIERAISAENVLDNNISDEVSRAAFAEGTISESLHTHLSDESNPHKLTKEQLELGNVDNTSDMNKPVSMAQQNALNSALSTHNTSDSSHNDIRLLISELTTRLNALADSDDTTLDQLSEIVAYIKNNKSLIDGITTSKVNVSDIIDNLTSSSADKVLSSKQGMILKGLITDLTTLVGNKVDKVSGKGLSTNDYTTAEKNKLSGVVSGTGQANKVWKTDANGNPGWRDESAISGSLIMNEVKLNDGKNNVTVLKAYDDGDTYNYGSELIVGGNGNTFIGAGESHGGLRYILQEGQRLPGELYDKTAERMYIGSDSEIIMYSNCQTMSNRKAIVFDSSGSLRPLANKTMSIGKSNFAFENVYVDKISSAKQTTTHLAGNQGDVIINSTAAAGAYTILDKLNSTNGYFTDGVYNGNRVFYYTPKTTVTAGTNSVGKSLTLLSESGDSSFPGNVSVSGALNFANYTWNHVGDDVYIGDHNISGNLCIKGSNSDNTGITFFNRNESASRRINLAANDRFDINCGIRISESSITPSLGGTFIKMERSDTNKSVAFGVGSSGNNRGIYDTSAGRWMIYTDTNDTHIAGRDIYLEPEDYVYIKNGAEKLNVTGFINTHKNIPFKLLYNFYYEGISSALTSYKAVPIYSKGLILAVLNGGSITSDKKGNEDRQITYLITPMYRPGISGGLVYEHVARVVTLQSAGSTSRGAIAASLPTIDIPEPQQIKITVPKGSWCNIRMYIMDDDVLYRYVEDLS